MKIVSLKCPECGATLKDLDMDRKECFCSYCGAKIVLDDEIVKQDIKIEKRIIDEAAIEEAKSNQIFFIVLGVSTVFALIVSVIILGIIH